MRNSKEARRRQRRRRKERDRARKDADIARMRSLAVAEASGSPAEMARYFSCAAKRRYTTEEQVVRACVFYASKRGVALRWYRCPHCGGWHITSKVS